MAARVAAIAALVLGSALSVAATARAALAPCRLDGVERAALCAQLRRPLDPARPDGAGIDVHYAVLPALSRRKAADPVFFFAGGPGQSAIDLAGPLSRRFARLSIRRDLVFVDQRGTGRSAPLKCDDDDPRAAPQPLATTTDAAHRLNRLRECAQVLQALPHGDLRQYTTVIAMADVDAVRDALGAERINAVGMSYGTRAVLEYQRQHPRRVRRAVLDGVVPPDMVLPAALSADAGAALDAVFDACDAEDACQRRYPQLREQWRRMLAGLPVRALVAHPVTGRDERITIDRDTLLSAVRSSLYVPATASALPAALDAAAQGRFAALLGLGSALGGASVGIATGMHFSVICAEDMPRLGQPGDTPRGDFGHSVAQLYRQVCAEWPAGTVPPAFYRIGPAASATLLLSGGADPATPPRHGERVARLLGPLARHISVAQAGHGVLALACLRDAALRFIDAGDDATALRTDLSCASTLPRPPAFVPIGATEGVPR